MRTLNDPVREAIIRLDAYFYLSQHRPIYYITRAHTKAFIEFLNHEHGFCEELSEEGLIEREYAAKLLRILFYEQVEEYLD